MNKTIICVQVRLKSKRCPLKALAPLYGQPLILRLTERLAETPYEVVWCTSIHEQDAPLASLAQAHGIKCIRGAGKDIATRFLMAGMICDATTIVRVTGDNPLTDPDALEQMVIAHHAAGADYTFTQNLTIGTRPEIIEFSAVQKLRQNMTIIHSYLTWEFVKLTNKLCVNCTPSRPDLRLTVDYPQDLGKMQAIYDHFKGCPPNLGKIIKWLDESGV